MNTQFLNVPRLNVTPNNEVKKAEKISPTAQGQEAEIPKMSTKSREMTAVVTREEQPKISSKFESLQISKFISPSQQNNSSNHNVSSSKISPLKQSAESAAAPPTPLKKSANVSRPVKSAEKPPDTTSRSSDTEVAKKVTQSASYSSQKQNSTTDSTSRVVPSSVGHGQPLTSSSASSNSSLPFHGKSSQMMSKADQRHEVKKILETKSNILEKASRRASALNMTRLCPTLVLATGSSTLRSVRLQELNVTFVILATTAEEAEVGGGSSVTPPTLLEGVANKSILLDENKDNEEQIELYFHNAADWIHELKAGVAMVHAPEGGAFKKGASLTDSRRGEGFAAALCAVSCIAELYELFIPFSFFVGFGRRNYENVYLHFLKVLPVLPCKQKPS